jgi:hypothetical protein
MHAALRLPLEGRHAEVPCRACHGADRPGLPPAAPTQALGTAAVAVALASADCASCHVDPHEGRYARAGARPLDGDCSACHTARAFRPSLVDEATHRRLGFELAGAHRAVSCAGCHEELLAPSAAATLLRSARGITRFPPPQRVSRSCAACHTNPHGSQFAARGTDRCETCHGIVAFAPATGFNHDRDASFRLQGAHASVACAKCHVAQTVAGVPMTVYRPLSGTCESCHDRKAS